MNHQKLHQLAHQAILDLTTNEGINASAQNESFGCIFGRDSALTILKIIRVHRRYPLPSLLDISRRTLLFLTSLQGKEFNLESGEQPGKFIHEFRKNRYEHLIQGYKPWFIYPDGILRNYDSLDSTPLTLIALFKYWQATLDNEFLITILPAVEAGLNWIITFGDLDKDQFLEYDFPLNRTFGGLTVQSWADSYQSISRQDNTMPPYPIAPIEVQALTWLALKLWSDFYQTQSPSFATKISSFADNIKANFNQKFIFQDREFFFGAQALDGHKNQITTVTANPLLCLWAAYQREGKVESIIENRFIEYFVKRAFQPDLFVEDAGIRTMSSLSPTFNPRQDSYHNGSFWPIINSLIIEGLENFSFHTQAAKLREASLLPLHHFGCPIELYIKNDQGYLEYRSSTGQNGCHQQAWSAAAILDMIT